MICPAVEGLDFINCLAEDVIWYLGELSSLLQEMGGSQSLDYHDVDASVPRGLNYQARGSC